MKLILTYNKYLLGNTASSILEKLLHLALEVLDARMLGAIICRVGVAGVLPSLLDAREGSSVLLKTPRSPEKAKIERKNPSS